VGRNARESVKTVVALAESGGCSAQEPRTNQGMVQKSSVSLQLGRGHADDVQNGYAFAECASSTLELDRDRHAMEDSYATRRRQFT
jgi:hypothetical protein